MSASLVALPGPAGADHNPTISISAPAPAAEGNSGTKTFAFTLTRTDTTEESSVRATVSPGAAPGGAEPGDYVAPPPVTVHFEAGDGEETVVVTVNGDTLYEADETFQVTLSAPTNATIGSGVATGRILNDDEAPTATIQNAADVTEGGIARFGVRLSAAAGTPVTVAYRTANGGGTNGAESGSDFNGTTGASIVIAAGSQSGEITVQTINDTRAEADEIFSVVLVAGEAKVGTPSEATAKILDNEPAPTLSIVGAQASEGGTLEFKVTLSSASSQRIQVTATPSDGSAVAPSDFASNPGIVEFAPGDTEETFRVVTKQDALDEPNENLKVTLSNPAPTATPIAAREATGTILDDDNNAKLSVADATVDEPSTGTATMTFTVTLAPASGRQVTVNWSTADGTGTAGSDYTAGSGALTFEPGQTSQEVSVAVTGDTVNEENETVLVNLAGESGAGVADGQGQGLIVDKNAPPSLTISDPLARESEGARFTVTLAGTTLRTVTVGFRTADGTARAGADYAARSGTVTFAPGEKTKTIDVTVTDDTTSEFTEDFFVTLDDPVNATIVKASGKASIEANDQVAAAPLPSPAPATQPKPAVGRVTAAQLPRMILGPRTVVVGGKGVARMLVTCQRVSPVTCVGSVSLERAAKPVFKLGTKKFSVRKGKKAYAPIKLSARGLKLLRKQTTLRVRVVVMIKAGTRTFRATPGIVTLKTKAKPTPPPPTEVFVDAP